MGRAGPVGQTGVPAAVLLLVTLGRSCAQLHPSGRTSDHAPCTRAKEFSARTQLNSKGLRSRCRHGSPQVPTTWVPGRVASGGHRGSRHRKWGPQLARSRHRRLVGWKERVALRVKNIAGWPRGPLGWGWRQETSALLEGRESVGRLWLDGWQRSGDGGSRCRWRVASAGRAHPSPVTAWEGRPPVLIEGVLCSGAS